MKKINKAYIEAAIEKDPEIGEDTLSDHNNVVILMATGHVFRIIKLILVIFNISYFVGIIFLIFAEITMTVAKMEGDID